MNKKEERLSPRAREILKEMRQYSSHDARGVRVCDSVNPSELNLYDRQKIGRELKMRVRAAHLSYTNEIKTLLNGYNDHPGGDVDSDLSLSGVPVNKRYPGMVLRRSSFKKEADDLYTKGCILMQNGDFGRAGLRFCDAASGYGDAHKYEKALAVYRSASLVSQYHEGPTLSWDQKKEIERIARSGVNYIETKMQSKRDASTLGSKLLSIVVFLGGIFFLSTNITGNVIGLSNTTSSWIGGVLILIGVVALGFCIKGRKNKVVSVKVSKKKK